MPNQTETLDKLYLEWSQFTVAKTRRELELESQVSTLEQERDALRLIVDVGTDDDPGTALSKLHKIQHIAASSMKAALVERVRERAEEIDAAYDARDGVDSIPVGAAAHLKRLAYWIRSH